MVNLIIHDIEKSVSDSVTEIYNGDSDLIKSDVLLVSHPLSTFLRHEDLTDCDVIEPLLITTLIPTVIDTLHKNDKRYGFVLLLNIESYVFKIDKETYMQEHVELLMDMLSMLDDMHVEVYVTVTEEFYNYHTEHLEIYMG